MTRKEELINHIKEYLDSGMWEYSACRLGKEDLELIVNVLEQESKTEWIPIKYRKPTEEEITECDFPKEAMIYDCKLPDDNEEVQITTSDGCVVQTTFYTDDGCYFECYEDYGEVVAWQPLPQPYREAEKMLDTKEDIETDEIER